MFFLPLLALVANCAAQNSTTAIASMCYNAMSCSQCTALLGCTYCLTSNRCLDNAVDVATLSTCASKANNAGLCSANTPCSARTTCASCLASPWCSFCKDNSTACFDNIMPLNCINTISANGTCPSGGSSPTPVPSGEAPTPVPSGGSSPTPVPSGEAPTPTTTGQAVTDTNGQPVTDAQGKPVTMTVTGPGSQLTDARGCVVLPAATVPLALGCTLDLAKWGISCGGASTPAIVSVPADKPKALLNSLVVNVRRCDAPKVELSIGYTLMVTAPFGTASVLKDMGIELPSGPQTLNITKALMQGQDVEIPVFPQAGIVTVATYKLGVAVLITKLTIEGASVSFGVSLRACLFAKDCIDTPLLTDIVLGSKTAGVCCLDPTLQCETERAMCNPTTTTTKANTLNPSSASAFALSLVLATLATVCAAL